MINFVGLISTEEVVEVIYDRELTPGLKSALASNHAEGDINALYFYTLTQEDEDRVRARDEYTVVWVEGAITGLDFSIEDNKPYLRLEVSRDIVKADAPSDLALTGIGVWSAGTYNQGDYSYNNNNIWQCTATSSTDEPNTASADWKKVCSAIRLDLTALRPDGTTVLTGFSKPVFFLVSDNTGREIPILCPFSSGLCSIVLAFQNISECGTWSFPYSTDEVAAIDVTDNSETAIKVEQQILVKVILPF